MDGLYFTMHKWNLQTIPFSRSGSFLRIFARPAVTGGRRRLVIGTSRALPPEHGVSAGNRREFYELALFSRDSEADYIYRASPWQIVLKAQEGEASIVFLDDETLLFSVSKAVLRLMPCHPVQSVQCFSEQYAQANDPLAASFHHLRCCGDGTRVEIRECPMPGTAKTAGGDRPYSVGFAGPRSFECAVRFDFYGQVWNDQVPVFAAVAGERRAEWEAWRRLMPKVPPKYASAAEMSWMLLWSGAVSPGRLLSRKAILGSKSAVPSSFSSLDACFTALAVLPADQELAFDQFRLMFDNQSPVGAFPGSLSNIARNYNCITPPLHGWAVLKFIERIGLPRSRDFLKESFDPFCHQTEWWFSNRDTDRDGICEYQHGSDSGFFNSTVFDQGCPAECPDLAAYLVLQCAALAAIAKMLARKKDEMKWKERGDVQLNALLNHAVREDRFVSMLNGMHSALESQALQNYMPVVLGVRLPENLRRPLVDSLSHGGPFLTEYGLATESPQSQKYMPEDGFRGPIWPFPTFIAFDGLVRLGAAASARSLAEHFCDTCARNASMHEHYNALTGEGLGCPGHTCTSAVFILLASWLASEK